MRVLIGGCTATIRRLTPKLGNNLGHLLAPSARNSIGAIMRTGLPWGADNGAFSGFDPESFRRLLHKIKSAPGCLFVVCPDKVADAQATLALFEHWKDEIKKSGQPIAFVGQDGQERLAMPWKEFDCFFVGGSTHWKLGPGAGRLIREAKRRGKWVHMGRVNSLRRLQYAVDVSCDSVDGGCFSRWGDKYIPWISRLEAMKNQGSFFRKEYCSGLK